MSAAEERAAIVKWLDRQIVGFQETAETALKKGDERSARDRFAGKQCCIGLRAAILRGEHREEG